MLRINKSIVTVKKNPLWLSAHKPTNAFQSTPKRYFPNSYPHC